jgi:hypothetical protein
MLVTDWQGTESGLFFVPNRDYDTSPVFARWYIQGFTLLGVGLLDIKISSPHFTRSAHDKVCNPNCGTVMASQVSFSDPIM